MYFLTCQYLKVYQPKIANVQIQYKNFVPAESGPSLFANNELSKTLVNLYEKINGSTHEKIDKELIKIN